MRWVLDCIQSWFSKTKGRWIVRPVAELAVQDCQNFCVPYMHVVSAVEGICWVMYCCAQGRFVLVHELLRKAIQPFIAGARTRATSFLLQNPKCTCKWKSGC